MQWIFFFLFLFTVTLLYRQYQYELCTPAIALPDAFSIYDGQRINNYQHLRKINIGIIEGSIMLGESTILSDKILKLPTIHFK